MSTASWWEKPTQLSQLTSALSGFWDATYGKDEQIAWSIDSHARFNGFIDALVDSDEYQIWGYRTLPASPLQRTSV